MKIVFTRFPYESANGGAEIQTTSLMRGLMKQGHEIVFIGSCPVLLAEAQKLQIESYFVDIGKPPVTKYHAISMLWRYISIKQTLKKTLNTLGAIDAVVMLSLTEKLCITHYASLKANILWLEHDPIGRWLTKNPWLPLLLRQSNHATTVTVSALSRQYYIDTGWNNASVVAIPNGVDTTRFQQLPRTESTVLRIGCVARLAQEKGLDILLEACLSLKNIQLTIVGKGPEEASLRSFVAANNLENKVKIVNNTNLNDFYNAIDLLILPSKTHDPFGLVVAEVMLLDVATIITSSCGISDYLTDEEDTLIIEPNSPDAIVGAIEKLRDKDYRSTIAKAGKKAAYDQFEVSQMVKSYTLLLKANS